MEIGVEHVIKCVNCLDLNKVDDFDQFLLNLGNKMSQVIEIASEIEEDNDDAVLQFVFQNLAAAFTQNKLEILFTLI